MLHQIYGIVDKYMHERLRAQVVKYMSKNRAHFSLYVDGSFDEYLRSRARDGVWGGMLSTQSQGLSGNT